METKFFKRLKSFIQVRLSDRIAICLIVSSLLFVISCSSSSMALLTPPPDFDSSTYLNPEEFGYNLKLNMLDAVVNSPNSSFHPISFEGGLPEIQDAIRYPRFAMLNNIQGEVVLEVYIDTTNTVTYIKEIESPHKALTGAAIRAVTDVEHSPATHKGTRVNSFIRLPLTFELYEIEVEREVNRRY